jgi:hypothetical protein
LKKDKKRFCFDQPKNGKTGQNTIFSFVTKTPLWRKEKNAHQQVISSRILFRREFHSNVEGLAKEEKERLVI